MENDSRLLSNVVNTQIDIHSKYGGVVPELASRKHLEDIHPVVSRALERADKSLDEIDIIAVTQGPGLIGSLLVGLSFAKALSLVKRIPYVGVDHMAGHLLSVFLGAEKPQFPYVALVASGGHSSIFRVTAPDEYILLGRTRDDAAGEAFDKVAKILGLGYPGGPIISSLSKNGNPEAIQFPRSWLEHGSLDFSFSGIKTSVANYVKKNPTVSSTGNESINSPENLLKNICASFQEAVVDVLVEKTLTCALQQKIKTVVLAGGVSANLRLRQIMEERGKQKGLNVFMPPIEFSTDNAAMVALAGYYRRNDATTTYDMDVYSRTAVKR